MARVLVVDDDRPIRELLRIILELEGYDVALAEDGVAALEFLTRASVPWVVLMDVMMPYLGGVEVCRRLHAAGPRVCQHQIALMTAGMLEEDECPALARVLLRKPFDVDRAVSVVDQLAHEIEIAGDALAGQPAGVAPLAAAS
jgi:two-component system response regulator MprA